MSQPEIFEGVALGDDLDEIIFTQLKTGKYGRFATHVQTVDAPDMTNGDWVKRALKATLPNTQLRILRALEKAIIHDDMKIRAEALCIFPIDRIDSRQVMDIIIQNLDKFVHVRHEFDPSDRFTRGIDFVFGITKRTANSSKTKPKQLFGYFSVLLANPHFVWRILPLVAQVRPDWLAENAEQYLGASVNADGSLWDVVIKNCKDPEVITVMINELKAVTPESVTKLRESIQKYIANEPYRDNLTHLDD